MGGEVLADLPNWFYLSVESESEGEFMDAVEPAVESGAEFKDFVFVLNKSYGH